MVLVDIIGVLLLIQGFGSLGQRIAGKDTTESFFVVNYVPQYQPYASILLGVLGILVLWFSFRVRRNRRNRG
ncbi:hypothetical protein [Amycolatopsis benzoatilytica]|uniref:hypothetical protein n=1 Tax=Amycolatopsis benzoatilytica TaxID=346045 RepID=UPI0003828A57|nr:hypothetical protein [Amycolatopsis benzoatilytica]